MQIMPEKKAIAHSSPADRKKLFEIYLDKAGRWCARRLDGLVFGIFADRASAQRFVRLEGAFSLAAQCEKTYGVVVEQDGIKPLP
jgi:hypothetical protein